MNARRSALLAALAPCVEFAMTRKRPARDPADVPGLALRVRADAASPAELMIYGTIGGGGWFSEGISASDVAGLLRDAGPGPIDVRINSGGGDVFDGIAMHTMLARHPGTVTTYVDGIAASAASVVMLAGDRIVAARNGFVMIHDAMTGTYGNADTHDRATALLRTASDNIADMYAERAGEDAAHWRGLMTVNGEDGTWYTGVDALAAGLVDEITAVPDDSDEDPTMAYLAGWVDVLPASIRATLRIPDNDVTEDDIVVTPEQLSAIRWDAREFIEFTKGAFA